MGKPAENINSVGKPDKINLWNWARQHLLIELLKKKNIQQTALFHSKNFKDRSKLMWIIICVHNFLFLVKLGSSGELRIQSREALAIKGKADKEKNKV